MAVIQSLTLYPVNTTTVDTGTGIDVRFLDVATGSADSTQTATFTNSNSNVERTFDPATAGTTNTNNAGTTMFKLGYALRLAQDMTPTNDSASDAYLPAQNVTVSMVVNASQSGGTYASGTLGMTFRASLWRYNPATDTGTLIAAGSTTGITWNVAATGGDLGTAKTATMTIAAPATVFGTVKGTAAEVFYLQLGFNTGTVPAPTLGTATFTITLTVGTANTSVVLASGLAELTYGTGSSSNVGTATGSGAPVLASSGSSSGAGTASAQTVAVKLATGSTTGQGTATGQGGAVKLGTGTATGQGTATGAPALVAATVGTVSVSSGGGTTIINAIYNQFD